MVAATLGVSYYSMDELQVGGVEHVAEVKVQQSQCALHVCHGGHSGTLWTRNLAAQNLKLMPVS